MSPKAEEEEEGGRERFWKYIRPDIPTSSACPFLSWPMVMTKLPCPLVGARRSFGFRDPAR